MGLKEEIEAVIKELNFARCNPMNCKDNHSDEYKHRSGLLEHGDMHVDNAISDLNNILEDLKKK